MRYLNNSEQQDIVPVKICSFFKCNVAIEHLQLIHFYLQCIEFAITISEISHSTVCKARSTEKCSSFFGK